MNYFSLLTIIFIQQIEGLLFVNYINGLIVFTNHICYNEN